MTTIHTTAPNVAAIAAALRPYQDAAQEAIREAGRLTDAASLYAFVVNPNVQAVLARAAAADEVAAGLDRGLPVLEINARLVRRDGVPGEGTDAAKVRHDARCLIAYTVGRNEV